MLLLHTLCIVSRGRGASTLAHAVLWRLLSSKHLRLAGAVFELFSGHKAAIEQLVVVAAVFGHRSLDVIGRREAPTTRVSPLIRLLLLLLVDIVGLVLLGAANLIQNVRINVGRRVHRLVLRCNLLLGRQIGGCCCRAQIFVC